MLPRIINRGVALAAALRARISGEGLLLRLKDRYRLDGSLCFQP